MEGLKNIPLSEVNKKLNSKRAIIDFYRELGNL